MFLLAWGVFKMKQISLGTKKRTYKSIRQMAEETGVKYITLYQRLRIGMKPLTATKKPVRKYNKKVKVDENLRNISNNQLC